MNTHRVHRPNKLPDPWMFDSNALLKELERIRHLMLSIPISQKNLSSINTVIDGMWRLEEQLRYLLQLHAQGQAAFAEKAQPISSTTKKPKTAAEPIRVHKVA
jgi:uncharacterized protein YjcR